MLPVIFAAAAGLAGFTGAWLYQENRYERVIAEQRATQSALLAEAHANARRETQRLQEAKDKALKASALRQSALARDLAANRDALGRLSHAADSALRDSSGSIDACNANANTLTVVLGRCAGQLSDVAADADRLASDRQTLIESWPK